MLVIVTTDGMDIEWHVGEPVPEMYGPDQHKALERISHIQADCDELGHIQKMFSSPSVNCQAVMGQLEARDYTIPMPNKRVCRWYGDLARTIFLNL